MGHGLGQPPDPNRDPYADRLGYYEDRGIAEKEEKLRQRELARVTWEMLDSTFELPDMDVMGKIREKQAVDEEIGYDTEDDEDFMWRMVSVWD